MAGSDCQGRAPQCCSSYAEKKSLAHSSLAPVLLRYRRLFAVVAHRIEGDYNEGTGRTPLDAPPSMLVDHGGEVWRLASRSLAKSYLRKTSHWERSNRHLREPCQPRNIGQVMLHAAAVPHGRHRILKSRGRRTKRRAVGGRRREEKNNQLRKREDGCRWDRWLQARESVAGVLPQLPRSQQTRFGDAWGPAPRRPAEPL